VGTYSEISNIRTARREAGQMSTVLTAESARDVRLAWFHYKNVTHRAALRRDATRRVATRRAAPRPALSRCRRQPLDDAFVRFSFSLFLSLSFSLSLSHSLTHSLSVSLSLLQSLILSLSSLRSCRPDLGTRQTSSRRQLTRSVESSAERHLSLMRSLAVEGWHP